jgi:hypothetical protein
VHGSSLTVRGILGTNAVLIGLAAVVVGQLAFTYLPFMQRLFDSRPIGLEEGAAIIAVGVALLLVVESEKLLRRMIAPVFPDQQPRTISSR